MRVLEFKLYGSKSQFKLIDEAIKTSQFVRNKCLRFWMDNPKLKINKYALNKYCSVIAAEFPFADKLNSMARQSAAERAWSAISRFYDNCKKKVKGKKGYPKFKKHSRSVEFKTTGWKLSDDRKYLTLTDKHKVGSLKLKGSHDLHFYNVKQIKRVRVVRRADGYYAQFCVDVEIKVDSNPTGKAVGLDLGLKYFIADSNGNVEKSPQFYRKAEKQLNRANRKKSKKYVKNKSTQSKNYHKARNRYARKHLRVSRQREEYCKNIAYSAIQSNDLVAYEDLKVANMVRNRKLAKSISDAGWSTFRNWLEYFGLKYGKITVAVPPHNTSQDCSNCGENVKKSLSTRTHVCPHCGFIEDRDVNASINILKRGLITVGHTGNYASGDLPSWAVGSAARVSGGSPP
ncbi:MAG: transposase [Cyanobacteria bacterium J06643_5]